MAPSAGLNVNALNAESSTENAIVSANCRYNEPVRPVMKPAGMNTADSTSAIPTKRTADLVHRLDRRIARRTPLFDLRLDRLDHDDRVINHQPDRKNQPQQRERVDREADGRKEHEGADQRDRNRQDRNQGRAPVLQKDEDHQHHQRDRFEQGLDDFARAFGDRHGGVEDQPLLHVLRKLAREFGHPRLRLIGGLQRVGAGVLIKQHETQPACR